MAGFKMCDVFPHNSHMFGKQLQLLASNCSDCVDKSHIKHIFVDKIMSFGPAGYEDDWDDDDFDFGEHCDTDLYTSHNFYQPSSQNYFAKVHVKEEASESMSSAFPSGEPKTNSSVGLSTNHNATPKISSGRGRGRGGFSSPKNQTKPAIHTRKNKKSVDKQNKGQGNFLFTRTSDKRKNILDEKDCQTAEDFRVAILKGDVAMVGNILNQGIAVDCIQKTGWTGLMHAANCGLFEVLTMLIEKGANVNFQKDMFSVLMAACSSDSDAEDDLVQCVNHLIEKGAKINCHDTYHMTPLMYACRNGSVKIVDVLLLHKPDVNKQDQRGWTALDWAASRGHGRVVRMLLDKNADPKQYTNDGQSAEDLAYDGGFTIIADILHAAVNPTRHIEQNAQNIQDSGLTSEQGQGDCLQYGDLELFLFGLELGHLVPLFQAQEISFDGFLQLTDTDLQQIGVSQVGVRKKILAATHDVHTKQWDLSSLPSQQSTNQFTGEDLNLILANVDKHLLYIRCSIGYARNSLHGMEDPTVIIQDEEHVQMFLDQTTSVLRAASGIEDEVKSLECCVKKIAVTVPTTAADLIHSLQDKRKERKFTYLPALVVGGCLALGLTAVWLSQRSEL